VSLPGRSLVRYFLSHSARTGHANEVVRQLRRRLAAHGHRPFVDSDLLAGEEWRSVLYHELAICDAAVVLLDRTSLHRRWVQREVDVLLWRRAFEPRLTILPVLLDDTTVAAVRQAGFGEFTERQFLLAGGFGAELTAERVVERFAAQPDMPAAARGTRMEQWFGDIAIVLGEVRNRARLRQAALELGVSPQDADQVLLPGGCRFLAHQFLGRSVDTAAVGAVSQILFCSDVATLRKLVMLIAPTWVDQSASRPLKVTHRPVRFVAVLNAKDSRTAVHYVHRATCLDPAVGVREVPGVVGEDGPGELYAQCEEEVLRLLGGEPPFYTLADIPPEEIRDGPPQPSYLVVNTVGLPAPAVAEVIERIRHRYRWLVVILLVSPEAPAPEAVARWGFADARVLEPRLGPHEEFRGHRTVGRLHSMIDRVERGGRPGD
jgi:TIR domain